jgi:hypothetical protein
MIVFDQKKKRMKHLTIRKRVINPTLKKRIVWDDKVTTWPLMDDDGGYL